VREKGVEGVEGKARRAKAAELAARRGEAKRGRRVVGDRVKVMGCRQP